MKLKKDSLLLKIIFYNNTAVLLTSLMIAAILTFITFRDIDAQIPKMSFDKIKTLDSFYSFYINNIKDDIYQLSTNRELEDEPSIRSEEGLNYQLFAEKIKSKFDIQDYKMYNRTVFTILGENGEVLGESGDDSYIEKFSVSESKGYINFILNKEKPYSNTLYQEKVGEDIVLRISAPYYGDEKIEVIIITLPIDDYFLKICSDFLSLQGDSQLFLLQDNEYRYGNLPLEKGGVFLEEKIFDQIKLREYKYYFNEKKIQEESYYTAFYPLRNVRGIFLGSLGIAFSRAEVFHIKTLILIFIGITALIVIILNSIIFGRIFYKTLTPLSEVAEVSNRISKGNYNVDLKLKGTGEIKTVINSFREMIKTIRSTQNKLKEQNLKLQENIYRINVIEKLLLGIYGEEDAEHVVESILHAFTSEMGLGYSRAIYLKYNRETESLVGERAVVNSKIISKTSDTVKGDIGGFWFQNESLGELVSFIKIPVREDSLLANALNEKKIIFYNDRGYKHDLGNEFLLSLGLNNFIIIPIYSDERDYGCILMDNFMKNRIITTEEVELLNILILNLGIHLKNKGLEKEKLNNERSLTIGKLSEKVLSRRNNLLDSLHDLIKEQRSGEDIREKVDSLEEEVLKVKRDHSILTDYSDMKDYKFEVFDLKTLFEEIYSFYQENLIKKEITASVFVKSHEKIHGDRGELKKAFTEIIDNSIDALAKNNRSSKKINIIISKIKNTEKVIIEIADNGIGVDETHLKKIYEPFVSYKKNSPGLGLSIARRIIKHHGGMMKIESQLNQGTQVKITLNAYKEEKK